MPQPPRLGIQLCLDRAGECERLAELATDVRSKATYVRMAGQWRSLAAHQEFVDQIDNVLTCSGKSKREEFDPPPESAPI